MGYWEERAEVGVDDPRCQAAATASATATAAAAPPAAATVFALPPNPHQNLEPRDSNIPQLRNIP